MVKKEIFCNALESVLAEMTEGKREEMATIARNIVAKERNGQDYQKTWALFLFKAYNQAKEKSAKYVIGCRYNQVAKNIKVKGYPILKIPDNESTWFTIFRIEEETKARRETCGLLFDKRA